MCYLFSIYLFNGVGLYIFISKQEEWHHVSEDKEKTKKETKGLQGFRLCIAIIISKSTDWYDMLDMKSALALF